MTILQIHVGISLVAILGSFVVIYGLLTGKRLNGLTAFTLIFTILTSVTGFFLPLSGLTPPVIVGILSLVLLAIAVFARYSQKLAGIWRPVYIVTAMFAFYLNFFVLVAQSFQKILALKPFNGGPVFLAVQVAALLLFVVATVLSIKRFRG
ncbi:MAG: hypothetical protein ABIP75_09155 [Pyrinomonadaceae bacterium]